MSTLLPGISRSKGALLFNNKGELNASSRKDAAQRVKEAVDMLASCKFEDKETREANLEVRKERANELMAAVADKTGTKMSILAEAIMTEILDQTNREGFARRLLQFKPLEQGDFPYITMRDKQVVAYIMSSSSRVIPTEIRERRQILNEFALAAQILISNIEIQRSSNDLLEEKYDEGLEAIMVQEDRFWKQLADIASTVQYNVQSFLQFSPSILARMTNMLNSAGLPASVLLISHNLMQDFVAGSEFQNVYDPVSQWEILQTGEIGSIYGVQIITDAMRGPNLRVLDPGDVYAIAAPEYHGVMYARPLTTEAINQYAVGQSKRGWFIEQITSMAIGNSRSVVRGKRLFN